MCMLCLSNIFQNIPRCLGLDDKCKTRGVYNSLKITLVKFFQQCFDVAQWNFWNYACLVSSN